MAEAVSTESAEAKDSGEAKAPAGGPEHRLKDSWSLWYDEGHGGAQTRGATMNEDEWMASMKMVCTFDTVEDFWAVFNNLIPASKMSCGSSFFLFKVFCFFLFLMYFWNFLLIKNIFCCFFSFLHFLIISSNVFYEFTF